MRVQINVFEEIMVVELFGDKAGSIQIKTEC